MTVKELIPVLNTDDCKIYMHADNKCKLLFSGSVDDPSLRTYEDREVLSIVPLYNDLEVVII